MENCCKVNLLFCLPDHLPDPLALPIRGAWVTHPSSPRTTTIPFIEAVTMELPAPSYCNVDLKTRKYSIAYATILEIRGATQTNKVKPCLRLNSVGKCTSKNRKNTNTSSVTELLTSSPYVLANGAISIVIGSERFIEYISGVNPTS